MCVVINPGYIAYNLLCTDINECVSGSAECHNNATCTNTEGSYECSCDTGFTGDGFNCTSEIVIESCTALQVIILLYMLQYSPLITMDIRMSLPLFLLLLLHL